MQHLKDSRVRSPHPMQLAPFSPLRMRRGNRTLAHGTASQSASLNRFCRMFRTPAASQLVSRRTDREEDLRRPDRRGRLAVVSKLALPRLVDHSASHSRLRKCIPLLRHSPFQAEQEPVIEARRIVDSILVENQRAYQRTQLEQPVPVGAAFEPGARSAPSPDPPCRERLH